MNYVQTLIASGVLSSGLFLMLVPLTDTVDNMLGLAIKKTASDVEDIAMLNHYMKDDSVLYSSSGFPSVRDGGIDKLIKSVGYTNTYDPFLNERVFLFNNKDTQNCSFTYNDVSGLTTLKGSCALGEEVKDKLNKSFEAEK